MRLDQLMEYKLETFFWKIMKKMFKLSCRPLAITSYKAFLKNKKRFGTSPCLIFYMIFEEIYVSCYILLSGQILL